MTSYPKKLYRDDDGQEFRLYKDDLYSAFIKGLGLSFQKYPYYVLVSLGFQEKLKDCKIVPVKKTNNSCGDDE